MTALAWLALAGSVAAAWCVVAGATGIVWGRALAMADRIELPTPSSSKRQGEGSC